LIAVNVPPREAAEDVPSHRRHIMFDHLILAIVIIAPAIFAAVLGWVSIDDALSARRAARH